MPLKDGILTKPFGIHDIAKCIGESSLDLGTLCRSKNIKAWAKFKPQQSSSWATTDAVIKGENNNYGLSFTALSISVNNIGQLVQYYTTDGWNGWKYNAPRLAGLNGITDRYRMFDFDGYNHNASPEYSMGKTLTATKGSELDVTPHKLSYINEEGVLQIGDLGRIKDYDGNGTTFYFGAFVMNSNTGELVDVAISETKITDGVSGVKLPKVANLAAITNTTSPYRVYCFLGSKPYKSGDLISNIIAIPFPNIAPATLNIKQYVEPIVITAEAVQGRLKDSVSFSVTVNNVSAEDLTLSNNYIRYYPTGSGTYTEISLKDFSVSNGKSYTALAIEGGITVTSASRWSYSLGNGKYTQTGLLVQMSIDITLPDINPISL